MKSFRCHPVDPNNSKPAPLLQRQQTVNVSSSLAKRDMCRRRQYAALVPQGGANRPTRSVGQDFSGEGLTQDVNLENRGWPEAISGYHGPCAMMLELREALPILRDNPY